MSRSNSAPAGVRQKKNSGRTSLQVAYPISSSIASRSNDALWSVEIGGTFEIEEGPVRERVTGEGALAALGRPDHDHRRKHPEQQPQPPLLLSGDVIYKVYASPAQAMTSIVTASGRQGHAGIQ